MTGSHNFVHLEQQGRESLSAWREVGLDFDPLSCEPFYMREEVLD